MLIYTLGTWIKLRVDEVGWSTHDPDAANNIGLFSGLIRAIVRKAI